MVLRTWSETCKALAPGAWKIGIATACLLSSNERKPYCEAASSTRATSPSRVTAPSAAVFKTISANSCSVLKRPCAFTESCKGELLGAAPMVPAAT